MIQGGKTGMVIIGYWLSPMRGMELMREIMAMDAGVKTGNVLIMGAKIRHVAKCLFLKGGGI